MTAGVEAVLVVLRSLQPDHDLTSGPTPDAATWTADTPEESTDGTTY